MKVSLIVKMDKILEHEDVQEVGVKLVAFYKNTYRLIFPEDEHGVSVTKAYPTSIYEIQFIEEE